MRSRIQILLLSFALLLIAFPAFADNLSLTFVDGAGTGTVSMNAGSALDKGKYLITSASGTINGLAIVSLVAPGAYPSPTIDTPNDNIVLYPFNATTPALDFDGISFLLFGGTYFNMYNDATAYFAVTGATPFLEDPRVVVTSFALAQTGALPTAVSPEPSTFVLLGTGLVAAASAMRRRTA